MDPRGHPRGRDPGRKEREEGWLRFGDNLEESMFPGGGVSGGGGGALDLGSGGLKICGASGDKRWDGSGGKQVPG